MLLQIRENMKIHQILVNSLQLRGPTPKIGKNPAANAGTCCENNDNFSHSRHNQQGQLNIGLGRNTASTKNLENQPP